MISSDRIRELLKEYSDENVASMLQKSAAYYMQKQTPQNFSSLKILHKQKNETDNLRIMTGKLLKSFKKGDPNNIYESNWNGDILEVTDGSKLDYAAIHNFGGDAGRNHATHLKPRPYLTAETGIDYFNKMFLPKLIDKFVIKVMSEFKP